MCYHKPLNDLKLPIQEPSTGHKWGPVDTGSYGMVAVCRGAHQYKIGYYDDDHKHAFAFVYFGVPFYTEPTILLRALLRPATVKEIAKWNEQVYNDVNIARAIKEKKDDAESIRVLEASGKATKAK